MSDLIHLLSDLRNHLWRNLASKSISDDGLITRIDAYLHGAKPVDGYIVTSPTLDATTSRYAKELHNYVCSSEEEARERAEGDEPPLDVHELLRGRTLAPREPR